MSDQCGPVEIDEHNPSDPNCDYAPEISYRVRIPRSRSQGGQIVLPFSPHEDAYLAIPLEVIEWMAEIVDVVMIVETIGEDAGGNESKR